MSVLPSSCSQQVVSEMELQNCGETASSVHATHTQHTYYIVFVYVVQEIKTMSSIQLFSSVCAVVSCSLSSRAQLVVSNCFCSHYAKLS